MEVVQSAPVERTSRQATGDVRAGSDKDARPGLCLGCIEVAFHSQSCFCAHSIKNLLYLAIVHQHFKTIVTVQLACHLSRPSFLSAHLCLDTTPCVLLYFGLLMALIITEHTLLCAVPSPSGMHPARRRSLGGMPSRPSSSGEPEDMAGRRPSHGPGQFLQKVRAEQARMQFSRTPIAIDCTSLE